MNDQTIPTGPHFPRSVDDVVHRAQECNDPFAFGTDVLLDYVPFDDAVAAAFLKESVSREQWEAPIGEFSGFGPATDRRRPVALDDAEFIHESAMHYAAFGWTKIEDERGISASRTIDKMREWLWLLGFDPDPILMSDDWGWYGDRPLSRACEHLGLPSGRVK